MVAGHKRDAPEEDQHRLDAVVVAELTADGQRLLKDRRRGPVLPVGGDRHAARRDHKDDAARVTGVAHDRKGLGQQGFGG
jgi:hypothetical protein